MIKRVNRRLTKWGHIRITEHKIFYSFLWILLWYICSFNTGNADYAGGYFIPYMDVNKNHFEIGYKITNIIFHSLGVNFFVFRMLLMTIVLLLVGHTILRYCKFPLAALSLFLIYPFFIQCVQIRNAISVALVLYAIRFLEQDTKKGLVYYAFFVAIAASFHKSAIFYLIFILVHKQSVSKIIKLSAGLFILEYIVLFKSGEIILQALYRLTGDGRILFYMELNNGRLWGRGMIPFMVLYLMMVLLYRYKKNYFRNERGGHEDILLKVSVLSAVFIPLYLLDGNYIRLCIYMLPAYYIVLLNFSASMKLVNRTCLKGVYVLIAVVLFVSYIGPLNKKSFDEVTKAVLTNNLVLEWLENDERDW